MVKLSVLIKRKRGMTAEEFHRYWKEKHGPLAMGVEDFTRHIRKYVQCHQLPPEALRHMDHGPASQFDGIVELWADSVDELERAFDSPGYKNVIQPDESNFCDKDVVVMVTDETLVKG